MKRLMISAIAAVVFLAVVVVWSSQAPSIGHTVGIAGTASLQKPDATAEARKLPVEEYEDMSLVFTASPKH
jgi:hypothetical protein